MCLIRQKYVSEALLNNKKYVEFIGFIIRRIRTPCKTRSNFRGPLSRNKKQFRYNEHILDWTPGFPPLSFLLFLLIIPLPSFLSISIFCRFLQNGSSRNNTYYVVECLTVLNYKTHGYKGVCYRLALEWLLLSHAIPSYKDYKKFNLSKWTQRLCFHVLPTIYLKQKINQSKEIIPLSYKELATLGVVWMHLNKDLNQKGSLKDNLNRVTQDEK